MFSTVFTLITLVLGVAGAHQSRPRAVHQGIAKRAQGDVELFKRYSSTRWSFYDVGLGACGKTNVGSDFIVALNSQQFGSGYPGTHCFETITLTYKGKSAKATIMDACPGCPYGGLDLSRGLFKHFASEDEGIITGDWVFGDSGGAAPTTKNAAVAATTKTTPTTTWTPEAVKTTKTTPTTAWTLKATPTTTWTPKYTPTTTWTPKATSTHKAATSTWTPAVKAAVTTSHTSSKQSPATTSSSKVDYSSSIAAARSSSATLASSFSSASAASASASVPVNTTAQIEDNLQAIGTLLASLGKLIMAAGLEQDEQQ